MKNLMLIAALVATTMLTGCIFPMKGTSFSMLTLNQTTSEPIVDSSVRPAKMGEAYSGGVLFLSGGDASIGAAMRNGGITKVHHVDYKVNNYFWLFNYTTTIVYGE